MRMRYTFVPTIFMIACVPPVTAQTTANDSKYIEVTISDSMEINPDVVQYMLNLMPEAQTDMYTVPEEEDTYNPPNNTNYADVLKKKQEETALKIKMQEKRFSDFLSKEKIAFTREENNSYSKYMYGDYGTNTYQPQSFVLTFNSFGQLNRFLEKMPDDIKYSGNVSNILSTKYHEYESLLLERTLNAARKQAQTIATISGVKTGNIIQF